MVYPDSQTSDRLVKWSVFSSVGSTVRLSPASRGISLTSTASATPAASPNNRDGPVILLPLLSFPSSASRGLLWLRCLDQPDPWLGALPRLCARRTLPCNCERANRPTGVLSFALLCFPPSSGLDPRRPLLHDPLHMHSCRVRRLATPHNTVHTECMRLLQSPTPFPRRCPVPLKGLQDPCEEEESRL